MREGSEKKWTHGHSYAIARMLSENAGQPRGTPRSISPDISFTCHEAWQKICPRVQTHSSTAAKPDVGILCFGNAAAEPVVGTFRGSMAVDADGKVVFDREGRRIEVCGVSQLLRIHSRFNVGVDSSHFSTCFGF